MSRNTKCSDRAGVAWTNNTYNTPRRISILFKTKLLEEYLPVGRVFVALSLAIVKGDIIVKNDTDAEKPKLGLTSDLWDAIQVSLYSRDGVLLNPSRDITKDLID